jgi:hypothetical protein
VCIASKRLSAALGRTAVHARTGCVLHWSYLPAKLRWLAETQPRVVRRVRVQHDFGSIRFLRANCLTRAFQPSSADLCNQRSAPSHLGDQDIGRVERAVLQVSDSAIALGLLASVLIAPTTTEYASKVALLSALALVCLALPVLRSIAVPLDRRVLLAATPVVAAAFAIAVVLSGGDARATAFRPLPPGKLPPFVDRCRHAAKRNFAHPAGGCQVGIYRGESTEPCLAQSPQCFNIASR